VDSPDREKIRNILVIRNDNIGDVTCTTPLFEALRRIFPKAHIAVLVCRLTEEVVRGNPFLDQVHVYDKAKHGRYHNVWVAWWKQYEVLRRIRHQKFDLVLGVRSGFSTPQAWMAYYSGARWRIGRTPKPKEEKFSFFYTHLLPRAKGHGHEVLRSMEFLDPLGVQVKTPALYFPLEKEGEVRIEQFLAEIGLTEIRPRVGVHLLSRMEDGRWWREENYLEVLNALSSRANLGVVFSYGPDQAAAAKKILDKLDRPVPYFASTDLKTFGAYVKALDLLMTLEGGPMHIAAAVGTPLIALFGKTDPLDWAPWGEGHTVLRKGNQENLIAPGEVIEAVERKLLNMGYTVKGFEESV
jgi:ADP-heptose:LPS heptosyltransferase